MREGVRGVGVGRGAYNLTKKGFLNKLLSDADQILFELLAFSSCKASQNIEFFSIQAIAAYPEGDHTQMFFFFVCLQAEWACNWKGL